MIVKCPACAEELEIDPVLLNQWGVCPHCQSSILFSQTGRSVFRSPSAVHSPNQGRPAAFFPFDGDSGKMLKIGLLIAAIGLFALIGCGLLAVVVFEGRARSSCYPSSGSGGSDWSEYSDFDFEKERARSYIDSLPAGQRSAFYGGSSNPSDEANMLTNLIESDNLDGAIKLLEER